MEDIKPIETVQPTEIIKPKKEIKRDEKGKYLPGSSGNPNGRPKGSGWADAINKVLDEGLAKGISKEDLVAKAIIEAHDNNSGWAWRFLSENLPKPRQQMEINTNNSFVVPDIYADRKNQDVDDEEEEGEDND